MDKSRPGGRQINSKNPKSFDFCNVTYLLIKNKSDGLIYYSFGGVKFQLEQGEEDPLKSPNALMSGKIEFMIPPTTTNVNIKILTVQNYE